MKGRRAAGITKLTPTYKKRNQPLQNIGFFTTNSTTVPVPSTQGMEKGGDIGRIQRKE